MYFVILGMEAFIWFQIYRISDPLAGDRVLKRCGDGDDVQEPEATQRGPPRAAGFGKPSAHSGDSPVES